MIESTIEIDAPAWFVREVSITVLTPGKTTGTELVKGDMMRTVIPGMQFDQTIQMNEPDEIVWVGPWYGLLTGTHGFEFTPMEPAAATTGDAERCTVRQWETFTGILSPFMSYPSFMGGKATLEAFVGVNADLKRYAERVWAERREAQA